MVRTKGFYAALMLFILLLTLASCGDENKAADIGSYTENSVFLPAEISYITDIRETDDGELCLLAAMESENDLGLWSLKKGADNWELIETYADKLPKLREAYEKVDYEGYFLSDGSVACSLAAYKEKNVWSSEPYNYIIDTDGRVSQLPDVDFSKVSALENNQISRIFSTGSGDLYIEDMEGALFAFDEDKAAAKPCVKEMKGIPQYTAYEDTVYAVDRQTSEILNPSPQDNEKAFDSLREGFPQENESGHGAIGIFEADGERTYYLAHQSGLWRGGETGAEKLIDGSCCKLGNDNVWITDILIEDENTVYVTAGTKEGPLLLKYTKTEARKVETELNAFVLMENKDDRKVSAILQAYQQEHPEVKINLEVGVRDETTSVSDIVKNLNTRILAGDGPDILFLDGMNAARYVEEGLLDDITEVTGGENAVFSVDTSFYTRGGKRYALPAGFSYLTIVEETEKPGQKGDINAFADQLEQGCLGKYTLSYVSGILYHVYFEGVRDSGEPIREEQLKDFYEGLKKVSETYEDRDMRWAAYDSVSLQPYSLDAFSLMGTEGGGSMALDYIQSISTLQQLYNEKNNGSLFFEPFTAGNEGIYIPNTVVGISSTSKEKEAAEAFIAYLFSEKGQTVLAQSGRLPMVRAVLADRLKNVRGDEMYSAGTYYELKPFSEADQKEILRTAESLKRIAGTDDIMKEIVMTQAAAYVNGDADLDTTVTNAMRKIKLYQAEQL